MRAITLKKYGDISTLKVVNLEGPKSMTKEDVLIQTVASNINPDDVLLCDGRTFLSDEQKKMIHIPGFSAIGRILKVGSGVKRFHTGQQVGYLMGPPGAYCEKRVLHHSMLLDAPLDIPLNKLVPCFREAVTAYILIHKAVKLKKESFVMVHGANSGVGHIVAQWCKYLGLKVIGTVDKEERRAFASRFCDSVISFEKKSVYEETKELTNAEGVGVVFDGIGEQVFDESLKCLQFGGTYLNYYAVGKPMDSIDISRFSSKSIFFGRPRIEHYQSSKAQMVITMQSIFDIVKKGGIDIISQTYQMNQIIDAYKDIKSGNINGSAILSLES